MDAISVDTVVNITQQSRRTWWRRISSGSVTRMEDDARGRTMLSLTDVLPEICVSMKPKDLSFLVLADQGDIEAQNDIGQLFSVAGKHKIAFYWLQEAAKNNHPDAMQWLGRSYLNGEGVAKDESMGIAWIAKAASHGHLIAKAQMKSLIPCLIESTTK